MKTKFLFISFFLFINIFFIFSHTIYHRYYPYYRYYPSYIYDRDYIFIETETIYIHRMGNISLDKDITTDLTDISKIVIAFGINAYHKKVEEKTVHFTESGGEKINDLLADFLAKRKIPDRYPSFYNLKSYNFENNILKLNFSNDNFYENDNLYEPHEFYFYILNYSLILPFSEILKARFDEVLSKDYQDEVAKFINKQKKVNIAGVSVFVSGFGLAGLLNIAGLITMYYYMNNNIIPIAVPASLFFSALGSAAISLSVGIPLWAGSYAKKKFIINF